MTGFAGWFSNISAECKMLSQLKTLRPKLKRRLRRTTTMLFARPMGTKNSPILETTGMPSSKLQDLAAASSNRKDSILPRMETLSLPPTAGAQERVRAVRRHSLRIHFVPLQRSTSTSRTTSASSIKLTLWLHLRVWRWIRHGVCCLKERQPGNPKGQLKGCPQFGKMVKMKRSNGLEISARLWVFPLWADHCIGCPIRR